MKIKLVETSVEDFLNEKSLQEASMKIDGQKKNIIKDDGITALPKITRLVSSIAKANAEKFPSFTIQELNEEQKKALRKKILANNVKNFLIATAVTVGMRQAGNAIEKNALRGQGKINHSAIKTADGLRDAGKAAQNVNLGVSAVNGVSDAISKDKSFIVKFNMKNSKGQDSFILTAKDSNIAKQVVTQALQRAK